MKSYKTNVLFFLLFITFSCKKEISKADKNKQSTTNIKYAKGFNIVEENGKKKLIIKAAYQNSNKVFEYLIKKKKTKTSIESNSKIIKVPVKRMVVTSTTHIPMLELLNEEKSIIGFPNSKYISSEKTRKLIDAKKIKEIGKESSLNTEILLDLKPELVVGFSVSSRDKSLTTIKKAGINVIYNGDWLEETPLGKAEWIKFFGVLLDKEKEADSIFNAIEHRYLATKKLALKAKEIPTVLSGNLFSDVWYAPGGKSFIANYFKDANTNYIWQKSKKAGSLPLSIETVLDKAKNATYWIGCGLYETKKDMQNSSKQYQNFNAYKTNEIYTYANKKGVTGGLLYFEASAIKPDLMLKDVLKITHPELLPNYKLTFFDRIE